jgi:hypothetical protein
VTHYPAGPAAGPPGFQPAPQLVFPVAVWQRLTGYVDACTIEVNGFGYVDLIGSQIHVADVFILDQVATAASVEVSGEALAAYLTDMVRAGVATSRIRLQWHSHVNASAYFSHTDVANIEGYLNADWMVSVVANKRGEFQARLDVFRPFRTWTPIGLMVSIPQDEAVLNDCREEIRSKVVEKVRGKTRPLTPGDNGPDALIVPARSLLMDRRPFPSPEELDLYGKAPV